MIIVAQVISIKWTKESRGAPGATYRNKIESEFEILVPEDNLIKSSFLLHHLLFSEENDFSHPKESVKWLTENENKYRCFSILAENSQAKLTYNWCDRDAGGAPKRTYFDKTGTEIPITKTLLVEPGEWKKLQYNGRFTHRWEGNWWYEKHIVNVAVLPEFNKSIFLETSPSEEFQEIRRLR